MRGFTLLPLLLLAACATTTSERDLLTELDRHRIIDLALSYERPDRELEVAPQSVDEVRLDITVLELDARDADYFLRKVRTTEDRVIVSENAIDDGAAWLALHSTLKAGRVLYRGAHLAELGKRRTVRAVKPTFHAVEVNHELPGRTYGNTIVESFDEGVVIDFLIQRVDDRHMFSGNFSHYTVDRPYPEFETGGPSLIYRTTIPEVERHITENSGYFNVGETMLIRGGRVRWHDTNRERMTFVRVTPLSTPMAENRTKE